MEKDTFKLKLKHPDHITQITYLDSVKELLSKYNPGDKERKTRYLFVTDATVGSQSFMQDFISKFDDDICENDALFVLGSGEPYKTIETVMSIVEKALSLSFSKDDCFVAIGGGVICDITSLAASIYKRGLNVDLVPTTLLSMVDSVINGETSCNLENSKNVIGTVYAADHIYFVKEFLDTLSPIQYKSGLAEAIKTAILFDKDLYDLFKNHEDLIKNKDPQTIISIIHKCVSAKIKIYQDKTNKEQLEQLLHLGHIFSYALESIVGVGVITHGEAVAWGISRCVALSLQKGLCLEAFKNEIFQLLENFGFETNPTPSVVLGGGVGERILESMHKISTDQQEKLKILLPKAITEIDSIEIDDKEILSVLK